MHCDDLTCIVLWVRLNIFNRGSIVFRNRKFMKSYIRKIESILFLGLFVALSLFGQITGDLQVTVSDATNAVVPNATVLVRSIDTGTTRTVNTDATGSARVNQLAVGRYEIKISHDGFNTATVTA